MKILSLVLVLLLSISVMAETKSGCFPGSDSCKKAASDNSQVKPNCCCLEESDPRLSSEDACLGEKGAGCGQIVDADRNSGGKTASSGGVPAVDAAGSSTGF